MENEYFKNSPGSRHAGRSVDNRGNDGIIPCYVLFSTLKCMVDMSNYNYVRGVCFVFY